MMCIAILTIDMHGSPSNTDPHRSLRILSCKLVHHCCADELEVLQSFQREG